MKNKQNNRKYSKSSEKEKIVKNTNRHQRSDFSSMISQTPKHSYGCGSPKTKQNIEKYNTYMEFINSNKITTNDLLMGRNSDIFNKKKAVTPTPRKNSPLPYQGGRKTPFSNMYNFQQISPKSMGTTHKQSTKKPSKDTKHNSFIVYGSSTHRRKNSTEIKIIKDKKPQSKKNTQEKKLMIKGKKKVQKQKSTLNKDSLDSDRKLDKQQQKLFGKLFKGIQFYRDLGRGAHALVRSAVDWNTKRKIAVKIYDKSQLTEDELKSIQRQIQILMGLNHSSIIRLYQIIQTYKTINLIMEYGGGNSLQQYMKSKPQGRLSQKQAKFIFKQVVDAVMYLHQMKITHRDIKTQNILLNKHLNLKLIDFGFSLICYPQKNISSYCGTPTYMPPEVVSKTPHNPQLADRWSLGVLLFTILNGHCPFRASTQKQLFAKITLGEYAFEVEVHPLAKELIEKFLRKIPQERLSPEEALMHPWLKMKNQ